MHIAILGRQPALGIAELERVYGSEAVSWCGSHAALVETETFDLSRLGGTLKAGRVVAETRGDWKSVSQKIVSFYEDTWASREGKVTVGISAYGLHTSARDVQKTGIVLKQRLKARGVSVRLIPNDDIALSTATSHHNKLGLSDNKVELLVVAHGNTVYVAESVGAQNITAYAKRDQGRPKRDAFVGMLPPKLAQIMINLAVGPLTPQPNQASPVLLDPFCGTGVVLQEALMQGFAAYGTDLADKMIDYSNVNIDWLLNKYRIDLPVSIHQGDAMTTTWQQPIAAVACEAYLGQPFSAPPSPKKLQEVRGNCNHIISTFLKNIASQLEPGTPLCVGVPAWREKTSLFTHLPLTNELEPLGFRRIALKNVQRTDLLYFREDQVVARELLVIEKIA